MLDTIVEVVRIRGHGLHNRCSAIQDQAYGDNDRYEADGAFAFAVLTNEGKGQNPKHDHLQGLDDDDVDVEG